MALERIMHYVLVSNLMARPEFQGKLSTDFRVDKKVNHWEVYIGNGQWKDTGIAYMSSVN